MSARIINTIRHPYSSRQVLSSILGHWQKNRIHPVLIIARPGDVDRVIKNIRVALAKERAKQGKRKGSNYGFTQSVKFPFTENGQTSEAVVIRWRITPLQNLRNALGSDKLKEFSHVE